MIQRETEWRDAEKRPRRLLAVPRAHVQRLSAAFLFMCIISGVMLGEFPGRSGPRDDHMQGTVALTLVLAVASPPYATAVCSEQCRVSVQRPHKSRVILYQQILATFIPYQHLSNVTEKHLPNE